MGRINGTNSDYRFDGQGIVEDLGDPLYMKIFICPYNKPSSLQDLDGESQACEGTDDNCPQSNDPQNATGHAMIKLHSAEGIQLVTDKGNRIWIKQNGDIELGKSGGTAKILLKEGGDIEITATTLKVNGNLTVSGSYPGQ